MKESALSWKSGSRSGRGSSGGRTNKTEVIFGPGYGLGNGGLISCFLRVLHARHWGDGKTHFWRGPCSSTGHMAHRVPFGGFRMACYLVARAPNSIRVWLANARVWISNRAGDHARVRSNPSAEWRDYASRRALGHGRFLHLHRALVQAANQANLTSREGRISRRTIHGLRNHSRRSEE